MPEQNLTAATTFNHVGIKTEGTVTRLFQLAR